ncbi:MAG: archaetidylserine decarboxylase [Pseudomonadota bacterium]
MAELRPLSELSFAERLNFLATNRVPRVALTRFMGWFSKLENPLIRGVSIGVWRACVDDLRLFEAKKNRFKSLHDCFVRELKDDARSIDTDVALVSPCDAIVGEFGDLRGVEALQAKGFAYSLDELLGDPDLAERYRDGRFITLRLKSSMYHHFHAPCDGAVETVNFISGDTWNVNPIALKVVERLFCENERVVVPLSRDNGAPILLIAVAAILVASVRLHGVEVALNQNYRGGNRIAVGRRYRRGEQIGHFEHGSTIIAITDRSLRFCDDVVTNRLIRMGQPLMQASKRN